MLDFIWFIIIGLLAGWLAGKIMKGSGYGALGNLILGVIGSIVGGLSFFILGLRAYGSIGKLVMATFGAVVFIALLRAFSSRRLP